jgi:hypothetical protein
LHCPGFLTLLWNVLHRFGYTGLSAYRGCPYHQFGLGRCKVHVEIPAHLCMMAWFAMARGDDLDDTLERAAHQALMEFCERNLPVLSDTAIALLSIWNEGNVVWSERVGWALTARYAQHVSSLLQVQAKNRVVKDIQEGNRDLLQKNAHLETRIRKLNDELMRTDHNHDFKTDDLDDTRTQMQHAQDELTAAQSYIHHLETELHERDEQLEASQAQAADLQHEVEHLQELIPPEPEEDPKEIEGMYGVDDD